MEKLFYSSWAVVGLLCFCSSASAEVIMETRGRNFACSDASKMNLWDISANSPLIRHQMEEKDYCWRTVDKLRVQQLKTVGRFVLLQHINNTHTFFAYANDVQTVRDLAPLPQVKPTTLKVVSIHRLGVESISNTSYSGVLLQNGLPTVSFEVTTGSGLKLGFTIAKKLIEPGFTVKKSAGEKDGPSLETFGSCHGVPFDREKRDILFKVLTINRAKHLAEFEISGNWSGCGPNKNSTFILKPALLRIQNKNFDRLMRPHTAKEMERTWS